jgi:hypothetical protein
MVLFSCDHATVRCFVKPLAVDVSLCIPYTLAHACPLMYVSRLVRTQLAIHMSEITASAPPD